MSGQAVIVEEYVDFRCTTAGDGERVEDSRKSLQEQKKNIEKKNHSLAKE